MNEKQGWQAYIHENGKLQIKRYCKNMVEIDYDSPFIKEYLGELIDTEDYNFSRDEAEEYFNNKIKEK